jgi:hypothetical protein
MKEDTLHRPSQRRDLDGTTWRICFRFERGDAHDVEIVDYHKG